MRFVCLGFLDQAGWEAAPDSERMLAYDNELRRGGHFLGRELLQPPQNAATVRYQTGQAVVAGGPHAGTQEHLGVILFLEARDLNHAIQLMATHPCVRAGPFEIRPLVEGPDSIVTTTET